MINTKEVKGLLLFTRDHREKDELVKIFTESYGKLMFFVKGAKRRNNPLTLALFPFTEAVYIGDIRSEGLSFLNAAKDIHPFASLRNDIFLNAYGTYILNLVDAAIEDKVYDPALYKFTYEALSMIDKGKDPEIITNIFEVQILTRFGISPNWQKCSICGETDGKFDYSSQYQGIICEKHWSDLEKNRYHADPKAIHFLRIFANVSYERIQNIQVSDEIKASIRRVLDELFDEYVGIHLKSKKFIDEMKSWEDKLKFSRKNPKSDE